MGQIMHTSVGSTVSQSVRRKDRHTLACTNTHSPVSVPVKTGLCRRVSSFPVSSSRVGSGTAASANSFSWSHQSRTASAPRCVTASPAPCSHNPACPAASQNHRNLLRNIFVSRHREASEKQEVKVMSQDQHY